MEPTIFAEFDVSINTIHTPPDEFSSVGHRLVNVVITHKETGIQNTQTMRYQLDAETRVENVILTKFPDTESAQRIRHQRGLVEVKLEDGWDVMIGDHVHTALRKLCDSRSSSFWWNYINDLPPQLWEHLLKHSVKRMKEVTTPREFEYREALRTAWTEVFDLASNLRLADRYANRRHLKTKIDEQEWGVDVLYDDLTRKEQEAFDKTALLGFLALNYLTDDDWVGMIGYMVKYPK